MSSARAVPKRCGYLTSWRTGWQITPGGAEWMRAALGAIRGGQPPLGKACFAWWGVGKYSLYTVSALAAWSRLRGAGEFAAVPGAALVFYTVEAQMVFLFPLTKVTNLTF
jgi:hypothetical protein